MSAHEHEHAQPLSARDLLDVKVVDVAGEPLGHVEDLSIDLATGRVEYAILAFGGLLGVGEKLFPVPWRNLHWLPGEGVLRLQHGPRKREELHGAPSVHRKRPWHPSVLRDVFKQSSSYYPGLHG